MPTQKKFDAVAEIKAKIESNEIAIMSQYIGINVEDVTGLRRNMREAGVDYKVYKNTLARRALIDLGLEEAAAFIEGPTAWAFSEDPIAPARVLKEWSLKVKFIKMSGAVLNGKPLTASQLDALACLPGREQLLAQTIGTIAAPLRNFASVLSAVPRKFVNLLEALRKKNEEEGEAAA